MQKNSSPAGDPTSQKPTRSPDTATLRAQRELPPGQDKQTHRDQGWQIKEWSVLLGLTSIPIFIPISILAALMGITPELTARILGNQTQWGRLIIFTAILFPLAWLITYLLISRIHGGPWNSHRRPHPHT